MIYSYKSFLSRRTWRSTNIYSPSILEITANVFFCLSAPCSPQGCGGARVYHKNIKHEAGWDTSWMVEGNRRSIPGAVRRQQNSTFIDSLNYTRFYWQITLCCSSLYGAFKDSLQTKQALPKSLFFPKVICKVASSWCASFMQETSPLHPDWVFKIA